MSRLIQGVDISHWNEITDVNKLAAKCDFVYVKCSQGLSVDASFKSTWSALRGKTYRGIYHFLDFTLKHYTKGNELSWGKQQADLVYSLIKDDQPECPIWLDLENNEGDLSWEKITIFNIGRVLKIAMGFKQEWELLTKRKMGVYTRKEFAVSMSNFTDGILSVAAYFYAYLNTKDFITNFGTSTPKSYIGAWNNWTFWQYASQGDGKLFGLDGYVDLDLFNGDEVAWSAFVGKSLPTTTSTEPEDEVIVQPTIFNKGIVISPVNVRSGVGTAYAQWYLNGVPVVLPLNTELNILETKYDSGGNMWIRVGYKQWVCVKFNGMELVKLTA